MLGSTPLSCIGDRPLEVFGSSSSVGVAVAGMALLRHTGVFWVPGRRRLAFGNSEPPPQSGPSRLTLTCPGRRPCRGVAFSSPEGLGVFVAVFFWVPGSRRLAFGNSEPPQQSGPSYLMVICLGRRPCRGVAFSSPGDHGVFAAKFFAAVFFALEIRVGDLRSGLVSGFLLLTSSGGFGVP